MFLWNSEKKKHSCAQSSFFVPAFKACRPCRDELLCPFGNGYPLVAEGMHGVLNGPVDSFSDVILFSCSIPDACVEGDPHNCTNLPSILTVTVPESQADL